jgi:sterol desaturase/sphingolipid hydroxylase (fatty acid hydroxylase superfamily)
MIALALVAGVLTWSFLEYCIHRWLGHDKRYRKNPFGVEHIRHHAEGNYFAPWWKKAIAASVVTVSLGAPAILLGGRAGAAWIAGFVGFYIAYEILHRLEHVWAGFGPYGRWARRHHFTHHFVDARCNHGVTSPLWDLVFGTYRRPEPMVVPRKLKMPWLEDPKTGEVRADWADLMSFAPRR